jgi:guanine deaminase
VTIYRARVLDTPVDPFQGGALRADDDCALVVHDEVIVARGPLSDVRAHDPTGLVIDLRDGWLLPGLVDTHVHYPQVRVIGALGMPLLEWLERCALPEECHLASEDYARLVAEEFCASLIAAGTTTALVFGSHFRRAVEELFTVVDRYGLRVTSGLVVSDRGLPEPLLATPERAHTESVELAETWHGRGRIRYAVTPRFSFSAGEAMLEACAAAAEDIGDAWFTSHVNENPAEVAEVARLFPGSAHYVGTYDDHGLLGGRSVLAHDVHATDAELEVLAARGTAIAHCPSSNSALGSGLFPLARHLDHGVRVALGSDVGAGTGFSLFKEGLQAYFVQRLLADQGRPLTPAQLLHLATAAGARALGLGDQVGDLSPGKAFDAVCLRPVRGTALDIGLRHVDTAEEALGKIFALASDADVADVWVGGRQVASGGFVRRVPG